MDKDIVRQIKKANSSKTTDELLEIWKQDNRDDYTDAGFEALRQLLDERGHSFPAKQPSIRTKEVGQLPDAVARILALVFFYLLLSIATIVVIAVSAAKTPGDPGPAAAVRSKKARKCQLFQPYHESTP